MEIDIKGLFKVSFIVSVGMITAFILLELFIVSIGWNNVLKYIFLQLSGVFVMTFILSLKELKEFKETIEKEFKLKFFSQ